MLRWTTSTTIPLPKYPKAADTSYYGTVVGTNIWMMIANELEVSDLTLFMMDTETNKIQTVECIRENFKDTMIEELASDGPNLYMIRRSEDDVNTVFVTDTTKNNLTWQKVLEFPYDDPFGSCQIIGETMYILCSNVMKLIIIDLGQKKPMKLVELEDQVDINQEVFDNVGHSAKLMKNNYMLYMIVQDDTRRTVHIVENDGVLRNVSEIRGVYTDNCVFTENGNTLISNNTEMESYDIGTNCWSNTTVEQTAPARHMSIEKAFELNNKIYALVHLSWHDGHQHDIRVLDLKPSLSNACWTNVVDEVMSRENMDQVQEIRKKLPDCLKSQIDSVANWRITDKEKTEMCELLEERFDEMVREIKKLYHDQDICKELANLLFDLFDSEDIAYVFYKDRRARELMRENDEAMEEGDDESETDDDDDESEKDDDDEMLDDEETAEDGSDMEE